MADKKQNKQTGTLGESIACKFLKNKGFSIIERNYGRKWGEIDIVARRTTKNREDGNVSYETEEVIHFVEVKSVTHETRVDLDWAVSHETWQPEEMVHEFKLNQIRKAAESWITERNWRGIVQVDVIAIRMVPGEKYATVKYLPNVIRNE